MHKKVIVASNNPVKINAVQAAFATMFPGDTVTVTGVTISSGVAEQPLSDAETYQGAFNRAVNAQKAVPMADFWVGLEGGIEAKGDEMEAFAWMVVRDKNNQTGKGRTGTFFLPPQVATLIKQGMDLGQADDIVFNKTNSKQANGAVGLLTADAVTRTTYYQMAVLFALIPFKNPGLY